MSAEECEHDVVPFKDGFGRCTRCGDESFPLTQEAAGRLPCCGSYTEHVDGCDGVVRQTWALAKMAEQELEQAIRALTFPPVNRANVRSRIESALELVRRVRWDGADPPPRAPTVDPGLSE